MAQTDPIPQRKLRSTGSPKSRRPGKPSGPRSGAPFETLGTIGLTQHGKAELPTREGGLLGHRRANDLGDPVHVLEEPFQ